MTDAGFGADAPADGPAVVDEQNRPARTSGVGRTVASGIVWSSIARFGAMGFGLIANAAVARLLSPGDFGSYVLAISSAGTLAMASQLGLPQTTVRAVAAANSHPDGNRARFALLRAAATAAALAGIVFVVLALGVGRLVLRVFPDANLTPVATLVALLVAVRVLDNTTPELFRGVRDFRDASIFGGALSTALLAVSAVAVYAASGPTSLATVLWLTIGASAISLALAGLRLRRQVSALPQAPREGRLLDLRLVSPALWIATVVSYAITQLDLWVVGSMGDAGQVALYGAAFRLSMLIMVPAAIANFVVPPLVVEMLGRGERGRLESVVQTVAAVAGAPALALVLVFTAFGHQLTGWVYGPFYEGAGAAVAILAAGKILNVLTGACGITLIMAGGQRQNLAIMVGTLLVTLPLEIAGFHLWGLAGLAAATAVGVGLQNAALMWAVRRLVGVRTVANPFRVRSVVRDHGGAAALMRELSSRRGRGR